MNASDSQLSTIPLTFERSWVKNFMAPELQHVLSAGGLRVLHNCLADVDCYLQFVCSHKEPRVAGA